MKKSTVYLFIIFFYILTLIISHFYSPYSEEISKYRNNSIQKGYWTKQLFDISANKKESTIIEKILYYGLEEYTLVLVHSSALKEKAAKQSTYHLALGIAFFLTGWLFLINQECIRIVMEMSKFETKSKILSNIVNFAVSLLVENTLGYIITIVFWGLGKIIMSNVVSSLLNNGTMAIIHLFELFNNTFTLLGMGVFLGLFFLLINHIFDLFLVMTLPWIKMLIKCLFFYLLLILLLITLSISMKLTGCFPTPQISVFIVGVFIFGWKLLPQY